jgi:hypothetical protein
LIEAERRCEPQRRVSVFYRFYKALEQNIVLPQRQSPSFPSFNFFAGADDGKL